MTPGGFSFYSKQQPSNMADLAEFTVKEDWNHQSPSEHRFCSGDQETHVTASLSLSLSLQDSGEEQKERQNLLKDSRPHQCSSVCLPTSGHKFMALTSPSSSSTSSSCGSAEEVDGGLDALQRGHGRAPSLPPLPGDGVFPPSREPRQTCLTEARALVFSNCHSCFFFAYRQDCCFPLFFSPSF